NLAALCTDCRARRRSGALKSHVVPVPVVDLPLGATEDRVVGSLDLEQALTAGRKSFEAGLFARAHRGFLYVDEVNLLEDHLVTCCSMWPLPARTSSSGKESVSGTRPASCSWAAVIPRRASCGRNCWIASACPWRYARRGTSRPG